MFRVGFRVFRVGFRVFRVGFRVFRVGFRVFRVGSGCSGWGSGFYRHPLIKDSLFTAKSACLTTTLKIFYEDFYQAHKTCLKQQGPVSSVQNYTNGHQQDKAQINQAEKQPDINIIARNENGEADLSVLLVEENSKSSKPLL